MENFIESPCHKLVEPVLSYDHRSLRPYVPEPWAGESRTMESNVHAHEALPGPDRSHRCAMDLMPRLYYGQWYAQNPWCFASAHQADQKSSRSPVWVRPKCVPLQWD